MTERNMQLSINKSSRWVFLFCILLFVIYLSSNYTFIPLSKNLFQDSPFEEAHTTIQRILLSPDTITEEGRQESQPSPKRKGRKRSKKDPQTKTLPNKPTNSLAPTDFSLDPLQASIKAAHPAISPRLGSATDLQNQDRLASCVNQSECIVPQLQLKKKYKIYFCNRPVRYGVKFYFLIREGLLLHPNVELVSKDMIDVADYLVYLPGSAPWHKTECNQTSYASRMIVLDEYDFHFLYFPTRTKEEYAEKYGSNDNPWYFLYFKRSFVRRLNGKFQGYPHVRLGDIYPLVYPIAEFYLPHVLNKNREIEVLCTLRGSKQMTTRLRVQSWVAEYGTEKNVQNIISSQVDKKDRVGVSHLYFEQMYNSRIIVTVNPANWEGDFRLWESMASGALVFVDSVFVPHQFPLVDKHHVIYFSNNNRTELFEKLDYYRSHPDEARRIAMNGYFHSMKYHRTVNLIDYVLRTAHVKEILTLKKKDENVVVPEYNYSGQYLNYMARLQEKMILKCDRPGIYEPYGRIPKDAKEVKHHLLSC